MTMEPSNADPQTSPDEGARIKKLVAQRLRLDERAIEPKARLAGDLGADSIDIIELMADVEESFDIHIPAEHATELATLDDIVAYVSRARSQS